MVDFSIALYSRINTDITECPEDISNLDIYALENSSFEDTPFNFCYIGDCVGLSPFDFAVEITPLQEVVEPVCEFDDYYLYAVDVEITISFLPEIVINTDDSQTLAAINAQLGEEPTNNVFTRGQLASITTLDLSNNENLDFDIFQYLYSLSNLDISSTTSDPDKLSKLIVLKDLEVLTAKNNNIQDYTPFANIISLRELYLDNDVTTSLFVKNFNILAVKNITPLTNLVNLRVLSLGNNDISVIPREFSNLSNLVDLNLGDNKITDITPLTQVPSLVDLNLSGNNIQQLPPAEDLANLTNLTNLNLNNNNIVDLSNLSGLVSLDDLAIENNPVNPETIPENIPVTHLDLSYTNLTNDKLVMLTIPSSLTSLNISNNQLSKLTYLFSYQLTIDAKNQNINYGILVPDEDDSTMFILDLSFLKDIDFTTPSILEVSSGGYYFDDQSYSEPTIIWEDINATTEVYFTFANDTGSFTGRVTLILDPNIAI